MEELLTLFDRQQSRRDWWMGIMNAHIQWMRIEVGEVLLG